MVEVIMNHVRHIHYTHAYTLDFLDLFTKVVHIYLQIIHTSKFKKITQLGKSCLKTRFRIKKSCLVTRLQYAAFLFVLYKVVCSNGIFF